MIIEKIFCEKCGGEVGSLKDQYLCRECGHLLSDGRIQELLTQMFEKHKGKHEK